MKESFLKENQSATPFRESIVPNELSPETLKKLKSYPELVIRQEALDGIKWKFGTTDAHEAVQKGIAIFNELYNRYKVEISHMRVVYGEDEMGQAMVYTITDKIHGKSLNKLRGFDYREKKDGTEALSRLYLSLTQYLSDVYKNGGIYLVDIFRNVQYVYGNTLKDEEKKLYLVDVDLGVGVYDVSDKGNSNNGTLYYCLKSLAEMIVQQENSMSRMHLVRFSEARMHFYDFLNSIDQDDPHFSIIEETRAILNSN